MRGADSGGATSVLVIEDDKMLAEMYRQYLTADGHSVCIALDGEAWATVVDANVPALPMEMDLQTQAGTCGDQWNPCADATTPAHVSMQVDWVVAYRMG